MNSRGRPPSEVEIRAFEVGGQQGLSGGAVEVWLAKRSPSAVVGVPSVSRATTPKTWRSR